ncbi:MAG: hypothetical protein JO316_05405 [Abitibacteriaceae bacterium]|nr:hypothetical protein [Abditibacteriaceae bacterium]
MAWLAFALGYASHLFFSRRSSRDAPPGGQQVVAAGLRVTQRDAEGMKC